MRTLKIYTTDDGRTEYAVATTSMNAAVEFFDGCGIRTSVSFMRRHGYVWLPGDLDETKPVEAQPGRVFRKPISSANAWERL